MSKIGSISIGQMFLGSVEIAKAYLGSVLVFQKDGPTPPTPDPGDISNYVQDGLVMHLDGIDKGQTSGRWTSLVGSTYYTFTTHSTSETNAVLMDGAGVITATSGTSVSGTAGTIEVCAQYLGTAGSAIVLNGSASARLCFIISANGYCFKNSGGSNQWNRTKSALFTCSANTTRCMLNGVVGGTKVTNNWSSYSDTIGGRSSGTNRYYANIRIYSIRKYNRILTEAEMLQNQKVDNARFNLGLTI